MIRTPSNRKIRFRTNRRYSHGLLIGSVRQLVLMRRHVATSKQVPAKPLLRICRRQSKKNTFFVHFHVHFRRNVRVLFVESSVCAHISRSHATVSGRSQPRLPHDSSSFRGERAGVKCRESTARVCECTLTTGSRKKNLEKKTPAG